MAASPCPPAPAARTLRKSARRAPDRPRSLSGAPRGDLSCARAPGLTPGLRSEAPTGSPVWFRRVEDASFTPHVFDARALQFFVFRGKILRGEQPQWASGPVAVQETVVAQQLRLGRGQLAGLDQVRQLDQERVAVACAGDQLAQLLHRAATAAAELPHLDVIRGDV